ncbi:hypothetical protein [uncultured Arcticibacterium sp.]|uniref:hypothetical protein n=1 Tax=uncultured Arcticibacterium sp. TaxID=2173042 RepID=UPI0030FC374F
MKIKLIAILLVSSTFISGCFERGKFEYVTTIDQTFKYTLDKSGEFSESSTLTSNEIARKVLDLDLADDFIIKEVNIKKVGMKFNFGSGSTADAIQYRVFVGNASGRDPFLSADGSQSHIPTDFFGQIGVEFAVTQFLNNKGAGTVKRVLSEVLVGNSEVYGVNNGKSYRMDLEGIVPNGKRLVGTIDLILDVDVTYETCEEVPIGFAEEECIF